MRCRNGHEIMQGDAFCVICGSTPGTPAENHVCANGHLVLPNSVFCSRCGSRVATDLANQELEISNTTPFNQALNLLKGHEVLLAGCVGGIATLVVIIALIFGGSSGQTLTVSFTEYYSTCSSAMTLSGDTFTVSDGNGKEVGSGVLGNPTDGSGTSSSGDLVDTCEFSGTTSVPNGLNTYVIDPSPTNPVSIGVSFSHRDLIDNDWTAYITRNY